ncbi:alpha/beta hydrolase [Novosphingobium sp.]|uniref:alpha/beta hydrolase n=1 Tax=Novosphingobium sp. TaxID=1874826 RepID=UPI002610ECE9|nr:alpha/beta hydrolase [Novosphingobium sp.]
MTAGTPHRYFQAILDAYAVAARPNYHQTTPAEARAMLRAALAAAPPPAGLPELAEVIDIDIAGPAGPIALCCYKPLGASHGTCVYFHAGGWVIGDLDLSDATCRRMAAAAGCQVVSVDYRLAPENPFPAPLVDAYAALQWASRELPGPLVVMGESAGGNLAAACAIKARDAGGPALAGQFLSCPVADHNCDTVSYRELGHRNWLLSTADMLWFWDHYCPDADRRSDPLASPLRVADAKNLPPALIHVAELDPLRDDGLAYAHLLASAGVAVSTRCDHSMLHGYLSAAGAIPQVAEALAQAAEWIRRRLVAAADNSKDL